VKIAQIAPLQVAVPPRAYGGTERVIANLIDALTQLGHDVTLFATGDSKTSAELIPFAPEAFNFAPRIDVTAYHLAMLAEIYRHADRFDVLHSHLDYLTLPFTSWTTTPTVLTLHGRIDMPHTQRILRAFRDANYVSISKSQRACIPDLNWVGTVYHSVDVDSYPFMSNPGDYLAFVGRISPDKGPEHAIAIAKQAGIPLKIAAKVDPADKRYYEEVFAPLVDHPLIEYLGSVDEQRKRELMANARALLLPIHWDEPFGMVFIEALACGTPVLTCPRGAVPELLQNGVTGYAYSEDDELVDAVRRVGAISREGCRAYAKRRFDIHRLALEYVNIYGRVRQRKPFFSLPAIEGVTGIRGMTDAVEEPAVDVVMRIGPAAPTPVEWEEPDLVNSEAAERATQVDERPLRELHRRE
jgi:glycosyltransferase involved in cell wall biosynthesis